MSASFDDTADRLTAGTYTPPSAGSVSFWWYPTFTIADGALHFAFSCRNSGSTNYWDIAKNTANRMAFVVGGEATFDAAVTGFTQNQWNHVLATWDDSANTREVFIGGSSMGTSALAFSLTGLAETLHIGNIRSDVGSWDARGRLAEFAIYNKILSTNEIVSLSRRASPLLVAPVYLVRYFPLIRDFKEFKANMVVTNAGVTVADHAPIFYPQGHH